VHRCYLEAGADCIISASYQATIGGFTDRGLSVEEAEAAVARAVELAVEARDEFWGVEDGRRGRLRPLVAASVGPYGAYLADGSEFTGDYDLDEAALIDFHRRRSSRRRMPICWPARPYRRSRRRGPWADC
jgi:homocysteine S-methyltransferase